MFGCARQGISTPKSKVLISHAVLFAPGVSRVCYFSGRNSLFPGETAWHPFKVFALAVRHVMLHPHLWLTVNVRVRVRVRLVTWLTVNVLRQVMASGITTSTATRGRGCDGFYRDYAGLRTHPECDLVLDPNFGLLQASRGSKK